MISANTSTVFVIVTPNTYYHNISFVNITELILVIKASKREAGSRMLKPVPDEFISALRLPLVDQCCYSCKSTARGSPATVGSYHREYNPKASAKNSPKHIIPLWILRQRQRSGQAGPV